jgi:predicted phosphodiesterase
MMTDLPAADMLIHAGDFASHGRVDDCMRALHWLNALPFEYRVVIAGNHDCFMDENLRGENIGISRSAIEAITPKGEGFHYLLDSGVEIEGLKFWGSPITPTFFDWAFMKPRGPALRQQWEKIPDGTDIVITHGVPYGVCDSCPNYTDPKGPWIHVGDEDLLAAIKHIEPKVYIGGHIHAGHGHAWSDGTLFINASVCDESYNPTHKPIVFDIDPVTKEVNLVHVY